MSTPSISVIIPVYNAASTLRACLDSILVQQAASLEVLLVDDGSTDESVQICDDYAARDQRIHVFHRRNQGVSTARNFGISRAKGEWIAFIDSDDRIDPGYFPTSDRHDCDLLLQNWRVMGKEEQEEHFDALVYRGEECRQFFSEHAHLNAFRVVWEKLLRRDIIEQYQLRFDTHIRLGEDTLFMLAYLSHCQSVEVLATSDYIYYRPDSWNQYQRKYHLSLQDFRLYVDNFWNLYQQVGFQSPSLIRFIYSFFYWCSNPHNSIWLNIRINAYPTVMKMKQKISEGSRTEKTKRGIFKIFSWILYH